MFVAPGSVLASGAWVNKLGTKDTGIPVFFSGLKPVLAGGGGGVSPDSGNIPGDKPLFSKQHLLGARSVLRLC